MDTTITPTGGAGIVDVNYYVKVVGIGSPNQVKV